MLARGPKASPAPRKGETALRHIVEAEATDCSIPVAWVEEADAVSWAVEDVIDNDLDGIFAESRRATATINATTWCLPQKAPSSIVDRNGPLSKSTPVVQPRRRNRSICPIADRRQFAGHRLQSCALGLV